jgi:hypothetical protein
VANDLIDFDLKMIRVMGLTYFIYGLVYYLDISAFLVPLPVAFYMLPIAAFLMFVRSLPKLASFVLLFIPILVLKDIWINLYPMIMEPLLMISLLVWLGWGVKLIFFAKNEELKKTALAGVSQFFVLTILLPFHNIVFISSVIVSLILITIFVRANLENKKATVALRISFLIQLMYVMYLLQMISNWQNS